MSLQVVRAPPFPYDASAQSAAVLKEEKHYFSILEKMEQGQRQFTKELQMANTCENRSDFLNKQQIFPLGPLKPAAAPLGWPTPPPTH